MIVIQYLDFSLNKCKLYIMRKDDHLNFGNSKSEMSARQMRKACLLGSDLVKLGLLGW